MFTLKKDVPESNPILSELSRIISTREHKFHPSRDFTYTFSGGNAKIATPRRDYEINFAAKPGHLYLKSLSRGEGAAGGTDYFDFELLPSSRIILEYPLQFHSLLNQLLGPRHKSTLDLPEEVEATLSYHDMPAGVVYALPENVLKNLSGFRIIGRLGVSSVSDENLGFSWDKEKYDSDETGKTLGVTAPWKKTEKYEMLEKGLLATGFVTKLTESSRGREISRFMLEGGMTYARTRILENLLLEAARVDLGNHVEGDYSFAGIFKTDALKLPLLFDGFHSSFHPSSVRFPGFTVYNSDPETRISFEKGDLETPAKISQELYADVEKVKISFPD